MKPIRSIGLTISIIFVFLIPGHSAGILAPSRFQDVCKFVSFFAGQPMDTIVMMNCAMIAHQVVTYCEQELVSDSGAFICKLFKEKPSHGNDTSASSPTSAIIPIDQIRLPLLQPIDLLQNNDSAENHSLIYNALDFLLIPAKMYENWIIYVNTRFVQPLPYPFPDMLTVYLQYLYAPVYYYAGFLRYFQTFFRTSADPKPSFQHDIPLPTVLGENNLPPIPLWRRRA